ncbi:hypothetical protein [Sporosarcina sp. ACRSL]|uniref:hypothetical protein n=1 Tax=Sporosarcina sp. ACRSL TaxID=2918215 RepID=UPI001EF541F2|nr:hypothetical protein [Sporosarcina sp. ACRSL]
MNKRFTMEGIFYRLDVGRVDYVCRGLAKIARKGEACEEADVLFVMVNPRSCKPTDDLYVYPPYQDELFEIPIVMAKQDPTQYQLMRLMERMKWNRLYIINLSDLRAGNLTD